MTQLNLFSPKFRDAIERSYFSVATVAEYLRRKGHTIVMLPNLVRGENEYDQRLKYRDDGDLMISFPIEVKHSEKHSWSGRDDFPFPLVQVMSTRHWEQLREKPYFTVFVSMDYKSGIIIPSNTRESWVEKDVYDIRGNIDKLWMCPVGLVDFINMTDVFSESSEAA